MFEQRECKRSSFDFNSTKKTSCDRTRGNHWVGVETGIPNRVIAEAARRDALPGLSGLAAVRTEVAYGRERSRIDVLALDERGRHVYIEVKNTTYRVDTLQGVAITFPDAVTTRGAKHLRELQAVIREGDRAAIVFFVHRADGAFFDVARTVDPAYAEALDRAASEGVEILPLRVEMHATEGADGLWSLEWRIRGLQPWMRIEEGS